MFEGPLSISEDEWRDKYLKICEKTIQTPKPDCITGALVSQLNTNVSPVIVENENIQEIRELDDNVQKQNSLDSRLRRRRVIKTAKYSDDVINRRKKSYNAVLAKEHLADLTILQKSFEKALDMSEGDRIPVEENVYEEIENYRPQQQNNDELYVLPIDTFKRSANILSRHAKTWPAKTHSANRMTPKKVHQKLSLQNSILIDENNKKFVEFDGEIKDLIKKLISNIDDNSLDDQSKKDLEKLQRYTDSPALPQKTYLRKYTLKRQAPVTEEDEEETYIEMLGSPPRSPWSVEQSDDDEADGEHIYADPKPTARKLSSTGEIPRRGSGLVEALPKFGATSLGEHLRQSKHMTSSDSDKHDYVNIESEFTEVSSRNESIYFVPRNGEACVSNTPVYMPEGEEYLV